MYIFIVKCIYIYFIFDICSIISYQLTSNGERSLFWVALAYKRKHTSPCDIGRLQRKSWENYRPALDYMKSNKLASVEEPKRAANELAMR